MFKVEGQEWLVVSVVAGKGRVGAHTVRKYKGRNDRGRTETAECGSKHTITLSSC